MELSKKIVVSGILVLIMAACSPSLKPVSSESYYEDLSLFRPVYTIKDDQTENEVAVLQDSTNFDSDSITIDPNYDITGELDSLLDTIALNNQQIKYVQGYTIQVYTGNSQEEANEAKAKVYRTLPESRPQVTYDLPNYKVKVGKYYYRLQAQKEFALIKKEFPSAILAPQQFQIN